MFKHVLLPIAQTEIQAALGKVISLARYRELLTDGTRWCNSGGKAASRAAG